jgi:hypothetical protein
MSYGARGWDREKGKGVYRYVGCRDRERVDGWRERVWHEGWKEIGRKRERERETETDRQTDRQTDRDRQRHRARQTETERVGAGLASHVRGCQLGWQ